MWQGLVDYKLGLILGATMFVGAYAGAHFVTKLNDIWLRRIFLSTVILLALKNALRFYLEMNRKDAEMQRLQKNENNRIVWFRVSASPA